MNLNRIKYEIQIWEYMNLSLDFKRIFHLNDYLVFFVQQVANFLLAEYYWEEMNKLVPGLFRKNPHNAEIKKLFGDQGGY